MITTEITLYEEPQPLVAPPIVVDKHSNYSAYKTYTQVEVDAAIADAINLGIIVGTRFRYKASNYELKVVGFKRNPLDIFTIINGPGVILCERFSAEGLSFGGNTAYSINELLSGHLEFI